MMKDIIVTALYNLGYILIFPGFLFCFFAGLLLCGIDRKLVAKMQKRVGPPVLQPFYDFFKLCGKESIIPAAASRTMFLVAPLVGLAALVVIQLFIPVFTFTAFSQVADIIVILYLLLIPAMSAIILLVTPQCLLITVQINEFAEKGSYSLACAFATILIIITYGAVLLMNLFIKHFGTSKKIKEES